MATQEQIELRRKWIEALRSGKYKQHDGALNYSGGYCCLGVACDIYDPRQEVHEYWRSMAYLPTRIKEALGLRSESGTFRETEDSPKTRSLAQLNDNGTPFAEIADVIESNPPGLFID